MIDKEAVTGADGSRELDERAPGDQSNLGPDETRDARAVRDALATGVPRCACCGQVLPEQTGRARPRKYCPDGQGGFEEECGVTCAELGPAKEKVERVFGRAVLPAADLERLGEQVSAAQRLLGPASPVARLLGSVTGTLTEVGERLDGTVASAVEQSHQDRATAQEALGREAAAIAERDAAYEQARKEVLARQEADQDRDTRVGAAERHAAEHAEARQRAEIAQGKAEGERDLHKDRAERADEAALRDRERLAEARAEVTALSTTVINLRDQLAQEAKLAAAEVDRVRTESARALDRLRTDTDLRISQAQADFAERLATAAAASTAEISRLGVDHTEMVRRLEQDHAARLAEHQQAANTAHHHLHGQFRTVRTGLHRLARAHERRRTADPADLLDHLQAGIADLLTDLDDSPSAPATPSPAMTTRPPTEP